MVALVAQVVLVRHFSAAFYFAIVSLVLKLMCLFYLNKVNN
jgi:hypothetical protein